MNAPTNQVSPMEGLPPKRAVWSRLFVTSAGTILAITGVAKIVSALGHAGVLGQPDPIFGLPFNSLFLSVGLIELLVAAFCLLPKNQTVALALVALISVNFVGYRVGLWYIHWPGYCPCLGSLTQAIHLSAHVANLYTLLTLIYLLLGSLYFLVQPKWSERHSSGLSEQTS